MSGTFTMTGNVDNDQQMTNNLLDAINATLQKSIQCSQEMTRLFALVPVLALIDKIGRLLMDIRFACFNVIIFTLTASCVFSLFPLQSMQCYLPLAVLDLTALERRGRIPVFARIAQHVVFRTFQRTLRRSRASG